MTPERHAEKNDQRVGALVRKVDCWKCDTAERAFFVNALQFWRPAVKLV